jgi:hypothetical protein
MLLARHEMTVPSSLLKPFNICQRDSFCLRGQACLVRKRALYIWQTLSPTISFCSSTVFLGLSLMSTMVRSQRSMVRDEAPTMYVRHIVLFILYNSFHFSHSYSSSSTYSHRVAYLCCLQHILQPAIHSIHYHEAPQPSPQLNSLCCLHHIPNPPGHIIHYHKAPQPQPYLQQWLYYTRA